MLRTPAPFVSIIILNYNGGKLLLKCVRSVLNTEYPEFEVLIVDNGSKDDSIKRVMNAFNESKRVKFVTLGKNFGYAEGNNIGYKYASPNAKYIVFLNNDVQVTKPWLKRLVRILERNKDIGVAQPLIYNPDNSLEEMTGGYIDVFGYDRAEVHLDLRFLNYESYNECFFAHGCALIVRRELIDKFGLFNPDYFLFYEETDFCWRLRLAGHRVAVIPLSNVYHTGGVTRKKYTISLSIPFHQSKNRLYTLLVNYEARNLVKYVLWTILSYVVDILRDIVFSVFEKESKKNAFLKARAMGHTKSLLYIITHFSDIWKNRLFVQNCVRRIKDVEIIGKFILISNPLLPMAILRKLRKILGIEHEEGC